MSALQWLADHWVALLTGFGVFVAVCTAINANLTFTPERPKPSGALEWLKLALRTVIDIGSVLSQAGARGVVGRVSVPGMTSKAKDDGGPSGAGTVAILFAAGLGFALALPGCPWEVAAYQTVGGIANGAKIAAEELPARCEAAMGKAMRAPEVANIADPNARNDAGHAAVARVDKECKAATKGIGVVSDGVALGITGIDSARKLKEAPKDQRLWLKTAFDAWRNLSPLLERLGVNVPKIPIPEVK